MTKEGESPLILDADYPLSKWYNDNGKQVTTWRCPAYTAWKNMFNRVYKPNPKRPSYEDVEVCQDWFTFSKFKEWFDSNYVEGYLLDKDLVNPFSKIYSPETCRYIPTSLNNIVSCSIRTKRTNMIGVSKRNNSDSYSAHIVKDGKKHHIGEYETEEDAHSGWLVNKYIAILETISETTDSTLAEGLRNHARILHWYWIKGKEFDGVYHNKQQVLEEAKEIERLEPFAKRYMAGRKRKTKLIESFLAENTEELSDTDVRRFIFNLEWNIEWDDETREIVDRLSTTYPRLRKTLAGMEPLCPYFRTQM